ncbi:hypothetical protein, partial [Bacillus licheniformis]|uniref:hypothetical protein n=1 Tax=Bacillus licheniformis TaxID=1402 RepID=UPI0011A0B8B2
MGMLLKGGEDLERGDRLERIVVEKRGRVRNGKAQVRDVGGEGWMDERWFVKVMGGGEKRCEQGV